MAIDLTDVDTIKYDIRASRTGSNIKVGIHDSGGTTTEHTANISSANTWQTQTWDVSGVSNANKDAINSIIITVVNANAANTFYIDNFYGAVDYIKTFNDDTSTLSEPSFVKGVSKLPSEIATLSEPSFIKGMGKNPVDTATLSEVYARTWTLARGWTDTTTLSEVAQKAISFIISEVTTLSDLIGRALGKNVTDTTTLSEVFNKSLSLRRWLDTATLTDTISKDTVRTFIDDVYSLTEAINKWHLPASKTTDWTESSDESGMWTEEEAGVAWKEL